MDLSNMDQGELLKKLDMRMMAMHNMLIRYLESAQDHPLIGTTESRPVSYMSCRDDVTAKAEECDMANLGSSLEKFEGGSCDKEAAGVVNRGSSLEKFEGGSSDKEAASQQPQCSFAAVWKKFREKVDARCSPEFCENWIPPRN